ncbi:MAG: hypothetical protein MZU79_01165 [Anaerotruncus sp.]|nr:hypothetical protein [Anaerotruncus sp.]
MDNEKISVRTEAGRTLEVMVVTKKIDAIWVVLGEGLNNSQVQLTPTNNGLRTPAA